MSQTDKSVPAPDGGWGWMVTFGAFMVHVIADGITYTMGIFLVEIMKDFQVGSEATSWIASILVAVTLGSGPIVSSLVNKFGCRAVAIAGAVVSSFGLGISVLATNVYVLYFTVGGLAGFGFGLMYLPAIVSVSNYFEKKLSFATGIAVCGSGVGTFVFAPLCETLITSYQWKGALLILAAIGFNGILFGAIFKPIKAPKVKCVETVDTNEKKKPVIITEEETKDSHHDFEKVNSNHAAKDQDSQVNNLESEMHKKDVVQHSNLLNTPEYRANSKALEAEAQITEETSQSECAAMMDFSLFKDPIFMLFCISNFCTSIGFNVPYVFMKDKALDLNIDSQDASFLIAVIGIANTVGRIITGYVSDKTWLNRLFLYNTALAISGIATALSAFCITYTTLVIYAAVFGATIGAYVGLTSVVLVDLLGLEKFTNAFGVVLLFQGIASLAGPPIAGRLKDTTSSYDPAFYVAGFMIAISGLMLFVIPFIKRCSGQVRVQDSTKEVVHLKNVV